MNAKLLPSSGGATGVLMLVALSFSSGCQAPATIKEAEAAATHLEDVYQAAIQERLRQWSDELASTWERELDIILAREIEKITVDGKVDAAAVVSLIQHQQAARAKNIERITLEKRVDREATAAWAEARRLREAIRRWLNAGQSTEERDEIFKLMAAEVVR